MAGLLDFDARRLADLVDELGIEKAWLRILATHIQGLKSFKYILATETFRDIKPLDENLIEGLSIGEIGVLYEYCVSHIDPDSRKENGQFFTPDDVARFMVEQAGTLGKGRWLDPCAGIGNLSWHLVNAQKDKEEFLISSMVLSDRDGLALQIARVLFAVSFQKNHPRLYDEIASNFVQFDFLSVASSGDPDLFNANELEGIPDHDFVIVNPPYLALKRPDPRFETARASDLYAYFLENIIKTSKGFVSVTPQSFTNAAKFEPLRRLLLRFEALTIFNFDNIPGNVFHGIKFGSRNSNKANSIRVAITVASEQSGEQRITSLLRWKTQERFQLFAKAQQFLSKPALTPEYFPKVSSVFASLYQETRGYPTLSKILVNRTTVYQLFVPAAPRYYISALKAPASRSSQKVLNFKSEADLNRAYLLLNSSFAYWWWRVRDGGMTLSLETIRSLPLLEFETSNDLVGALEESERANRTFKMNAGAAQENVKHPLELVDKLNAIVVPRYRTEVLSTHQNSELVQLDFLRAS